MVVPLWFGLFSGAGAVLAVVLGGVLADYFLED